VAIAAVGGLTLLSIEETLLQAEVKVTEANLVGMIAKAGAAQPRDTVPFPRITN
jgi:hypothetical protein